MTNKRNDNVRKALKEIDVLIIGLCVFYNIDPKNCPFIHNLKKISHRIKRTTWRGSKCTCRTTEPSKRSTKDKKCDCHKHQQAFMKAIMSPNTKIVLPTKRNREVEVKDLALMQKLYNNCNTTSKD